MDRLAVIADGALVVAGDRIVDVGAVGGMRGAHPDAAVIDLGDVVVLPGLVNAHAHLELSFLSRAKSPGSFVDWVRAVIAETAANASSGGFFLGGAGEIGIKDSLRFGVTSIGDISASRFTRMIRGIFSTGGVPRLVSYGEVTAMGQRRGQLEQRLEAVTDRSGIGPPVRLGISPHAPYSIEAHGYRRCLETAVSQQMPLATHMAETPYEAEFLASHTGPFRDLWDGLGAWDDQVPTFRGGPIRYARALGLLDYPRTLLAHVNYCDEEELSILAAGRASVVYCPRTHRYFGHPPHRWREMLHRGINVALGTDSCASSPDVNLVDDLRLVHEIAPEHPVERLWEMVTIRAAQAIDAVDSVGTLTGGKYADFVCFGIRGEEPLREILKTSAVPVGVWVGGRKVSIRREPAS
jgi:cytosine/adenosine deaminase-related metal-dependent hydrolase